MQARVSVGVTAYLGGSPSALPSIVRFTGDDRDPNPTGPHSRLRFHEATTLTPRLLEHLRHEIRRRVLRHFTRHPLLEPHDPEDMLSWDHGGGFSLDASARIEANDRAGLERLIRYCARPPRNPSPTASINPPTSIPPSRSPFL